MKKVLLLFLGVGLMHFGLLAQGGTDNASNTDYNSGWQTGNNGGSGFGAWTLHTTIADGSQNGHFIGTSDLGDSWALYANSGQTSSAFRDFSTSPDANDIIKIQMDNGSINNGGVVGIGLRNASGENLAEVYFKGGDANYYVNDNAGERASTIGYTSAGLQIEFRMTSATAFDVVLTHIATPANTQTISGNLSSPGGGQGIAQIRVFNFNAGNGNDQFFNNLEHIVDGLLPVSYISFTATALADNVVLDWRTAMEENNARFEVERSRDGRTFEAIGEVMGAGTTLEAQAYQYIDAAPAAGVNYYRLKQVDWDGAFEYSPVVSAKVSRKAVEVAAFPNPVTDQLQVTTDADEVRIVLLNVQGQIIQHLDNAGRSTTANLPMSHLPKGIYFVQIQDANSGAVWHTERIVKQ